jgi:hypothetical protein
MFGRKKPSPQTYSKAELHELLDFIAPSRPNQALSSDEDPKERLLAAATHVGALSPPDMITVKSLGDASPCSSPSNEAGVWFTFAGVNGEKGKVFFFPQFASLWVDGEPRPRAQIPTEMIHVRGYHGAMTKMISVTLNPAQLNRNLRQ